jgi:phosphoribosylformylglycinamidine synthase
LVIPGGFSYGDDLGAGRILATQLSTHLYPAIARLLARGGLVLGICNGFQALVKAGLLPSGPSGAGLGGEAAGAPGPAVAPPAAPPAQRVTLAHNRSGHFEARWVHVEATTARSPWLDPGERLELPVAHGEGRLAADEATLDLLEQRGLVALRYARPEGGPAGGRFPWNPNGSARDIAGLCDPTGRILGLMPHPERNVAFHHHPAWTRGGEAARQAGAGLRLFERAVRHARAAGLARAAAVSGAAGGGL